MRRVFVKGRTIRAGLVSCGRRALCGMAHPLRTARPERRAMHGRNAAGLGPMQTADRGPQHHGAPGRGHGVPAEGANHTLPGGVGIGPDRFPAPYQKMATSRCGIGSGEALAGQHAQPPDAARGQVYGPVEAAIPAGLFLRFAGGSGRMGTATVIHFGPPPPPPSQGGFFCVHATPPRRCSVFRSSRGHLAPCSRWPAVPALRGAGTALRLPP